MKERMEKKVVKVGKKREMVKLEIMGFRVQQLNKLSSFNVAPSCPRCPTRKQGEWTRGVSGRCCQSRPTSLERLGEQWTIQGLVRQWASGGGFTAVHFPFPFDIPPPWTSCSKDRKVLAGPRTVGANETGHVRPPSRVLAQAPGLWLLPLRCFTP